MPPARIHLLRTGATWILRAISLTLVATGIYLMLKRITLGIATGEYSLIHAVFDEIGEGQSFHRGLAMIVVGAALGAGSRRLARWLTPPPLPGCPNCGYERIERDRCPECGLAGFNSARPD